MDEALIIFIRNPEPGKVKTRIAAEVGAAKALDIYLELLKHTYDATRPLRQDKYLFYAEHINLHDEWDSSIFHKRLQQGQSLGERMQNAFAAVFKQGYQRVIIMGSDCPQLTSARLQTAFEELKNFDAVIGPAKDGGYYLMGMNKLHEPLFRNKAWGTGAVLADTIADFHALQLRYSELPQLFDVDNIEDWNLYKNY